ncbi:hypothetical protein [Streptomyces sp. NPDC002676]
MAVEPVSHVWINDVLGMPARRLRQDRLLHEAQATGGDPRRICDLFGLTVDQAGLVEYDLRNAGPRPKARADGVVPGPARVPRGTAPNG